MMRYENKETERVRENYGIKNNVGMVWMWVCQKKEVTTMENDDWYEDRVKQWRCRLMISKKNL